MTTRLLAALLALSLAGCSWTFMDRPTISSSQADRPSCTASRIAPVADAAGAVLGVAAAATAGSVRIWGEGYSYDENKMLEMTVVAGLFAAMLHTASGWRGYNDAERCRELHASR